MRMRRKTVMVGLLNQGKLVGDPVLMVLKRGWFNRKVWRNVDAGIFTGIPEGIYYQAVVMDEDYTFRIARAV